MTELNIVLTSFKLIYVIIILSMANRSAKMIGIKSVNRRNHPSTGFVLVWRRKQDGMNKLAF